MFERGISVIVIVATLMLSVTGCGSRGVIDRDENTSHPIDYKIICDKDVSKDSLLMSTTDFILHTNNLSKPSFAISEKIKNKFNLWIPDRFEPQGQLMELWSIDDYRRSRHRISGVYQERGECKNYPDGWYINPIYGDDNFYNPFTGKIYKNQYPPGLLDIENKLSIQLVEFEDRITALQMVNFSNTPVWTLNSLPMMRDLRLCIMENYVITNSDYIGYHLIDISAGTVLCRLVNTYYGS